MDIVHLHPVAHRYFTFAFLVPSLCGLSMFKTLNSVSNTCHFIKIFKTLHVSASIGHPQVLKKLFIKKTAVILGIHAPMSLSSVCLILCCDTSHKHARKQQGIRHTKDRGTKGHEYLESQQFS
jgi:hypothetical protein